MNDHLTALEAEITEHLDEHPDAGVYRSLPGLGVVLGARVLSEFGDDPAPCPRQATPHRDLAARQPLGRHPPRMPHHRNALRRDDRVGAPPRRREGPRRLKLTDSGGGVSPLPVKVPRLEYETRGFHKPLLANGGRPFWIDGSLRSAVRFIPGLRVGIGRIEGDGRGTGAALRGVRSPFGRSWRSLRARRVRRGRDAVNDAGGECSGGGGCVAVVVGRFGSQRRVEFP
jgi:hypothetical protein